MHMAAASPISAVHPDIIETQIIPRLDASALASASCVSSELYSLISSNETIWTNICNFTWPSTDTPRLHHVISTFPSGPRSFFSDSITNPDTARASSCSPNLNLPSELISAVDIHYQKTHIFSKAVETKTFNGSPFKVDLLDPKETVPTRIPHPVNEDMYGELAEGLTLSWILIDPVERRAMNLSSYKPVTAEISWLSAEEVHVRYAWVFSAGEEGSSSSLENVKCGVSVTCERSESGEMHVTKVMLQLQDSFGKHLSGEDSLVILKKGMMGKRRKLKWREEEGKRRYEEYLKMRSERLMKRERTHEIQRRLHTLRQSFSWVLIFVSLVLLFVEK